MTEPSSFRGKGGAVCCGDHPPPFACCRESMPDSSSEDVEWVILQILLLAHTHWRDVSHLRQAGLVAKVNRVVAVM